MLDSGPCPPPPRPPLETLLLGASGRPKWKSMTVASEDDLAAALTGRNGAASAEREDKFRAMEVPRDERGGVKVKSSEELQEPMVDI